MHYKLFCFDLDGVIFKDINFWISLHKKFGTLDEGIKLTQKYLHSDYPRLVKEVMSLWEGKDSNPYYELVNSLEYISGVFEVFDWVNKLENVNTAIVSASSIDAVKRAQKQFNIDSIFGNELVIKEGLVTGEFNWPIGAGNGAKADAIHRLCLRYGVRPNEVVYIGDSITDVAAFKIVGMSIAFNSTCEELKQAATYIVDEPDLRSILKFF